MGTHSVQVNIPAESGEMGILAQHVASIEQLKPGLVEIIEESGGNKQFFRTFEDFSAYSFHRSDGRDRKLIVYSVGRVRCRSTKLRAQHQCCRRVSSGGVQ